MQITFLIGGTGNQLFQFATSKPNAQMSTLFLKSAVRKTLKWTQHEQVIKYEEAGVIKTVIALTVLAFDLVLAKIAKLSLFTDFDTRGVKQAARLAPLVRLGYFQETPMQRSLAPLAKQIAPISQRGLIAMHVRGGDLLQLERAGKNEYGMLDSEYYRKGIMRIRDSLKQEGRTPTELLILTDDPDYAATQDFNVDGVPAGDIQRVPLKDTLAKAVGAEWYISSNSTISFWIVQLREGSRSIAPQPFQKRRDYDLHPAAQRLALDYA